VSGIIIDSDELEFVHFDSPWESRDKYMSKMKTLCGTDYEQLIKTIRTVNCPKCIKTIGFCKKVKKEDIRNG